MPNVRFFWLTSLFLAGCVTSFSDLPSCGSDGLEAARGGAQLGVLGGIFTAAYFVRLHASHRKETFKSLLREDLPVFVLWAFISIGSAAATGLIFMGEEYLHQELYRRSLTHTAPLTYSIVCLLICIVMDLRIFPKKEEHEKA